MVGIFRITGSKVSCEDSFSLDLCIHTLVVDNASNASNLSWILRLPSTTSTCACQLTITAAGSCTVLGSQVLNAQNPRHRFMADSKDFSDFSTDRIYGSPQRSRSKFIQPLSFAIGYLKALISAPLPMVEPQLAYLSAICLGSDPNCFVKLTNSIPVL